MQLDLTRLKDQIKDPNSIVTQHPAPKNSKAEYLLFIFIMVLTIVYGLFTEFDLGVNATTSQSKSVQLEV